MDKIIVFAPATVGNVGPCYDIMGYALDYVGDFVTLEKVEKKDRDIIWGGIDGPYINDLDEDDYRNNAAWVVADKIWKDFADLDSLDFSLFLKLHKYLPVGSGIGSSAASSVAAAFAITRILNLTI